MRPSASGSRVSCSLLTFTRERSQADRPLSKRIRWLSTIHARRAAQPAQRLPSPASLSTNVARSCCNLLRTAPHCGTPVTLASHRGDRGQGFSAAPLKKGRFERPVAQIGPAEGVIDGLLCPVKWGRPQNYQSEQTKLLSSLGQAVLSCSYLQERHRDQFRRVLSPDPLSTLLLRYRRDAVHYDHDFQLEPRWLELGRRRPALALCSFVLRFLGSCTQDAPGPRSLHRRGRSG